MKEVKRLILPLIFSVILLVVFLNINYIESESINAKDSSLVIYGDNIKTNYAPFVENGGVYISLDTISKLIDKDIFYDSIATKVIITTSDKVIKFKIDDNKMSTNFEYSDITTPAKLIDGQPYIDINLVKSDYGIKTEYNQKTNTIVIDKISTSDIPLKYNMVNVYSDISTKSKVVDSLNKDDKITVYKDSLNHNSWYKIKTDKGVVGYISKNNVNLDIDEKEDNQNNEDNGNKEKIIMFWQQNNSLDVLGDTKIEGVNIVSPEWYTLKNSSGDISSNYSSGYYSRAKEYGYKLWPIINNGFGAANYSADTTSALLNSEYNRENFIKNLRDIAKKDNIDGINIDFESIKDADRDIFAQFMRELTSILRNEKITVSVDFYFVKSIDREKIGNTVDYVVLMGYDQKGTWSNESGSISSVNVVETQISSLLNDSKIPSDKVILGIPFYTRLWIEKNATQKPETEVYSMQDCVDFVNRNKITPVWDEDAGQNYAQITKGALTYKLWIEDNNSIKKRVEVVNKYNLAGISAWKKGLEMNDTWKTIIDNMKKN